MTRDFLRWRKSSNSACVALAETPDAILMRNSNRPTAGTLTLTPEQMAAVIADAKAGRLDNLA